MFSGALRSGHNQPGRGAGCADSHSATHASQVVSNRCPRTPTSSLPSILTQSWQHRVPGSSTSSRAPSSSPRSSHRSSGSSNSSGNRDPDERERWTLPPVVANAQRGTLSTAARSENGLCGKLGAYARRLSPGTYLLRKKDITPPERPTAKQFRRKHAFWGSSTGTPRPVAMALDCKTTQGSKTELPLLTILAQSYQHLLHDIAEFAVGRPKDMYRLCYTQSHTLAAELRHRDDAIWNRLYLNRWPAFHDGNCHHYSDRKWRELYRTTLVGHHVLVLEVFNRLKSRGFVMSAMPARVNYVAKSNSFLVRYMSASPVPPEVIPASEGFRLRFCPPDARHLMQESTSGLEGLGALQLPMDSYPFQVLQGYDHLVVGQGVELQWKMQSGSPFGWWFAKLESLKVNPNGGECATATLTFPHFPSDSQWHRLEVRFGDNKIRNCHFGGFTGGLRRTSRAEQEHWQLFMPNRFPVS